jgi:penicillin amidase
LPLWLKGLFLLPIVAVLGSGAYLYQRGRASLPQIDGSLTLRGLSAPVEVLRDPQGVPHLFGSTPEDLARAAGFIHAQDRLFQMEILRRLGSGRLAELLGESVVTLDRTVRLYGLGLAARVELDRADSEVRSLLTAYAEGVNSYVETHRNRLPPEFQILGVTPEPWEPTDSLAIVKWMAYLLSENASVERLRAQLIDAVGIEHAYLLTGLPPPPEDLAGLPAPTLPAIEARKEVAALAAAASASLPRVPPVGGRGASNAWAVSGARSLTGRPLVASDPHLALHIPSTWYEMHLSGGGLNVSGASIPGLPLIVIGHNDRVAWGVTALYADVQDQYVETLNPSDSGEYAVEDGWESFETAAETIEVAGGNAVTLEIERSRHGVVVSGEARNGRVLALRWDALWSGDAALAFLRVNRAEGWLDLAEALRTLTSPALAFVFADVDGNIGVFAAGQFPVRTGFDGSVPVDGASGELEWEAYVPHELKPYRLNPEEGFLVSANQRFIHDDPDYPLGLDQLSSFRADRIATLLGARAQATAADFQAIQADRYDSSTEPILRHLVALNVEPGPLSEAQSLLRSWDGKMQRGAAPALYQAFYSRLVENTFRDDVGETLYADLLDFIEMGFPGGVYAIVDDPGSDLWDDRSTPTTEDRSAIFLRSLEEATVLLASLQGSSISDWDWAALHAVPFEHTLGRERMLGWWFNRGPTPFGGSTYTVANAMVSLDEPFRVRAGTSLRMVMEVGNWDATTSVVPTGVSGHPLSSHYFDQNEDWETDRQHPLLFERSQLESAQAERLLLNP